MKALIFYFFINKGRCEIFHFYCYFLLFGWQSSYVELCLSRLA